MIISINISISILIIHILITQYHTYVALSRTSLCSFGFPFGRFFFLNCVFFAYNTWRETITALGGFRLFIKITILIFIFIRILSILIILTIPVIFIILIILCVLIIVVINSFLLPSLLSSSVFLVSFIVPVSNFINIKRLALFVTRSSSKKPRETVAAF
jgi:hypothetical protein